MREVSDDFLLNKAEVSAALIGQCRTGTRQAAVAPTGDAATTDGLPTAQDDNNPAFILVRGV
jgi:hypothetical protein